MVMVFLAWTVMIIGVSVWQHCRIAA